METAVFEPGIIVADEPALRRFLQLTEQRLQRLRETQYLREALPKLHALLCEAESLNDTAALQQLHAVLKAAEERLVDVTEPAPAVEYTHAVVQAAPAAPASLEPQEEEAPHTPEEDPFAAQQAAVLLLQREELARLENEIDQLSLTGQGRDWMRICALGCEVMALQSESEACAWSEEDTARLQRLIDVLMIEANSLERLTPAVLGNVGIRGEGGEALMRSLADLYRKAAEAQDEVLFLEKNRKDLSLVDDITLKNLLNACAARQALLFRTLKNAALSDKVLERLYGRILDLRRGSEMHLISFEPDRPDEHLCSVSGQLTYAAEKLREVKTREAEARRKRAEQDAALKTLQKAAASLDGTETSETAVLAALEQCGAEKIPYSNPEILAAARAVRHLLPENPTGFMKSVVGQLNKADKHAAAAAEHEPEPSEEEESGLIQVAKPLINRSKLLLIGGNKRPELVDKLKSIGALEVEWHTCPKNDKPSSQLTAKIRRCHLVLFLKNICGHTVGEYSRSMALKEGRRFVWVTSGAGFGGILKAIVDQSIPTHAA
jgi:hypothetical protein